jgi:hypothetical protein
VPSSYTASARYTLQATGENNNTWGTILNANTITLIDENVNGRTAVVLAAANVTLTSLNGLSDQARKAILSFSGVAGCTVTIPSVSKTYVVYNSATGTVTISTGAGTTVAVESGSAIWMFCDGTNVRQLGFANLGLKDYIDAAVLAATGSLPATTGNDGKAIICVAGAWTPTFITRALISDYGTATAAEIQAGTDTTKVVAPAYLATSAIFQSLTDAATIAWNIATGYNAKVTLGGNRTLGAPTNYQEGLGGVLKVTQDGTGSRTLAYNACWDFGALGAPTLSTAAGTEDAIFYVCTDAATPKFKATFFAGA